MTNARDKANIPVLNFQSKGIDDNADATAITINSSEQVGIGTSAPAENLQVMDTASNIPKIRIETSDGGNKRLDLSVESSVGTIASSQSAQQLAFKTAGGEAVRIDATGQVGIGTSSPGTKLEVVGTGVNGIELGQQSDGNDSSRLFFTNSSNVCAIRSTGGNLKFSTGATINSSSGDDRVTFTSDGKVGIGTSSPAHNLEIVATNSGSINDTLQIRNNTTTTGSGSRLRFITSTDLNSDTNGASIASVRNGNDNDLVFEVENSEAVRIDHAGNVGIGTSSPSQRLHVYSTGTTARFQRQQGDNNLRTHIEFIREGSTAGEIQCSNTSTTYATSSDYRLKENVVEIEDATTRLKQLKPKRFNFIANTDITIDGFLAHEVSSVVPEAITGTKDAVKEDGTPEYQGIDQSKLVPLLVKTIQELEARITTLETNNP